MAILQRCVVILALVVVTGCAGAEMVVHTAKQANRPPESVSEKLLDAPEAPPAAAPVQAARPARVGKPYTIRGQRYVPRDNLDHVEEGLASWYGGKFHGRRTASGEIYDMNDMTAAHKTLGMPTVVEVTNLENGRSVKVRINDRGPFVHGRIIDLSRRAAQLLGFEHAGVARVRIQVAKPETLALRGASPEGTQMAGRAARHQAASQLQQRPSRFFVDAGRFESYDEAARQRARMNRYGPTRLTEARDVYQVQIGPFTSADEAVQLLETLRARQVVPGGAQVLQL